MLFAIEEDLWFGDTSEREAEALARESDAYDEGYEAALHHFPDAARRILELPKDGVIDARALITTLQSDVALCDRVVQLARTAVFAGPAGCESLPEAVATLGPRTISEVAIAAAMFEAVHNGRPVVHDLRDHAASVASLARFLALELGVAADDVYAAALLHDVGKLFLWQAEDAAAPFANDYVRILEESRGQRDYAFLLERRRYGFDHAILGAELAQAWRLPHPIPAVVRLHHNPARAYELGGEVELMVSLLRLADRLAYELQRSAERLASERADRKLAHDLGVDEAATALGLGEARMRELWEELQLTYVEGHALFSERHG